MLGLSSNKRDGAYKCEELLAFIIIILNKIVKQFVFLKGINIEILISSKKMIMKNLLFDDSSKKVSFRQNLTSLQYNSRIIILQNLLVS